MGANSGACHGENPEGAADGARGMSWEEELVREPIFVAAPSVEKTKSCIAAKAKPRKAKSTVKRKRRISFSEDDIVYDCAELYYPFVDQHESKRYDSEISRCPKSGEFSFWPSAILLFGNLFWPASFWCLAKLSRFSADCLISHDAEPQPDLL